MWRGTQPAAMLLPALLIVCGLLCPASCGASPPVPAVTTSSEPSLPQQQQHSSAETVDIDKPEAESQTSVTLDQVIDMISDFQQATTRAGTAQPLAELAKTLAAIQTSVLVISGRLDVIQDSQLQQQKVQADLAKRLDEVEQSQSEVVNHLQSQVSSRFDIIEQSQSEMSSHLDGMAQSQNVASSRLDVIRNTLSRLDGLQQNQTEAVGRLVEVREAQSTLSSGLPARLDVIETSLGTLSGRVDTVLQQQQQQAAATSTLTAAQEQLDAILAAVSRIPKTVLGTSRSSDTDCSRLMPEATCGDSGLCSCRDGYRQLSDTVCRMVPRLTEPCLEEADCQTLVANATCTRGVCACASGFWNHDDAECRQVSAVAKDGSCVGDQDCASISRLRCFSGTCSCPSKMIGNEEYRLVGGSSCAEGNVELRKRGGSWGVVCDDYWNATDAGVLCRSLDFRTGTSTILSEFGSASNFYMDNVGCTGSETHLTVCRYKGWGSHDCNSGEVAGVRCYI